MKKPKAATVHQYLHLLSPGEKALICLAVRAYDENFKDAHPGMLPFLSLNLVIPCLMQAKANGGQKRPFAKLLSKLEYHKWVSEDRNRFLMVLDNAKVAKHFGNHPELGKPLPHLAKKKVTVGVRWSLPRKKYEPDDDVHVTPCVALDKLFGSSPTKTNTRFWLVKCDPKYRYEVELWLLDHCGAHNSSRGIK